MVLGRRLSRAPALLVVFVRDTQQLGLQLLGPTRCQLTPEECFDLYSH
jgi:hypothetical protein